MSHPEQSYAVLRLTAAFVEFEELQLIWELSNRRVGVFVTRSAILVAAECRGMDLGLVEHMVSSGLWHGWLEMRTEI